MGPFPILSIAGLGQFTVTEAEPEVSVSPRTVAVALSFEMTPQVRPAPNAVVVPVTWMTSGTPTVTVWFEHVSTLARITQPGDRVLQVTPAGVGSVSLTVTFVAFAGPALLTVRSKPMRSPATTGPARSE